jgi:Glycosyltransferase family 9 (heptosyltransferase)
MAAMRRGEFAKAWAINDAVLANSDPAQRDDPRLPYHLRWVWDGRDYRGRDVLVRCYHGLGDTIQFARYLPALRPVVASLTIEVQPKLLRVLATMPGPDRLVPFLPEAPSPPSACDIEIMELPHALRLPPQAAPQPPYLPVRPANNAKSGIGMCWQSGAWDQERDLPEAHVSRLLRSIRGRAFTLQPVRTALPVHNPSGAPVDIMETASLIAGLDLVITVDTLFAHLAGALNRPTWLLLKHAADWRWMADRSDSPWYPTMRLYRQPAPGDWASVIEQVEHDIKAGR